MYNLVTVPLLERIREVIYAVAAPRVGMLISHSLSNLTFPIHLRYQTSKALEVGWDYRS